MEARRILKQYVFSLVVILCIGAFFIGTVSAKEKTQYNMDMTPYTTVSFEKEQGSITFYYGDSVYVIRTDFAEKIRNSVGENLIFDFRQIFT